MSTDEGFQHFHETILALQSENFRGLEGFKAQPQMLKRQAARTELNPEPRTGTSAQRANLPLGIELQSLHSCPLFFEQNAQTQ